MTKLVSSKVLRTALALILTVLLAFSLVPVLGPAYGSNAQKTVAASEAFENISDVLQEDVSEGSGIAAARVTEGSERSENSEGPEGPENPVGDAGDVSSEGALEGSVVEGGSPEDEGFEGPDVPEGEGAAPAPDGEEATPAPGDTGEGSESPDFEGPDFDEATPGPEGEREPGDSWNEAGSMEDAGSQESSDSEGPDADEALEPSEDAGESDEDETELFALSPTVENKNDIVIEEGVTETGNLRYTNNKTYTLTVNGVLNGTIYISGGAMLNLEGSGIIDGNGAPTVIHVEGDKSVLNVNAQGGCITITGGAGGTPIGDIKNFPDYNSGGGILVQRKDVKSDGTGGTGATLNLYNGVISGNWAGSGGGIHIDRDCSFYMAGGEVSHNSTQEGTRTVDGETKKMPAHEAGGIYVAGSGAQASAAFNSAGYQSNEHAFIEGGIIINNSTHTTIDWGGGGIFVESRGVLRIGTASITGNHADGLGGGVSGCPHASIGIGDITDGAAIWGNSTSKLRKPFNSFLTVSQVQDGQRFGDMYAYGLYESDFKAGELVRDSKGKILHRKGLSSSDAGLGNFVGKGYSKDQFIADYAQDYYCTKVSAIMGPNVGVSLPNNEVWKGYTANADGGSAFTIQKGEVRAFSTGAVGLTSLLPASFNPGYRDLIIEGNTSTTHGGGIGCNGKLIMGTLPEGETYGDVSLEFQKKLVNSLGETLNFGDYTFDFELAEKGSDRVYTATTDPDGKVTFVLHGEDYLQGLAHGEEKTVEFELREIPNRSYPDIDFDTNVYPVKLTFMASVHEAVIVAGAHVTFHVFDNPVFTINDQVPSEFVVTNIFNLWGSWAPSAKKFLHGGTGVAGAYTFELVEIEAPQGHLDTLVAKEGGEYREATNGEFAEADGSALVVFDDIFYAHPGEHWYLIRETNGNDPVVYVLRVVVAGDNEGIEGGDVSTVLVPTVTEIYYAYPDAGADGQLTRLEGDLAVVEFHNNEDGAYGISGYAVNGLTGAPLTQKCLVDPKIIKELEGRTLKSGEFSFQLIEVVDYTDTTGIVISETSNDAYGMVDFDAAANKADPGWEPSCLLFTQPGTYKYRVIEDPSQLADPSVNYSDQVITFTVVVELDPETGILAASDMYYGYLNEAGENVRYKEQYQGWETMGEEWVPTAADYPRFDTSWHPTMVNRTKPMDLAVRKTSALTGEALEGATYALYLVNHGDEADIHLGSSTSDADGWIYFEDVSLKTGNLYYFLEESAPEGHTVSKFHSKYFYLTPDASADQGYLLNYTDNKFALEESGEEETPDEPNSGDETSDAPASGEGASGEAFVLLSETAAAAQGEDGGGIPADSFSGQAEENGDIFADSDSEQVLADVVAGSGDDVADGVNGDTGLSAPTGPTVGKDGALLYVYEADNGVQDEATYIEFNKLDTRNHEWVEGAKLSVVEKETGIVVNSWTSGTAPEVLQKVLDVGVVYVLRENEAPEGYEKAADVEFRIGPYGEIEILAGDSNGNAELSGSTLTLYDTRIPVENVVVEEREVVREVPENKYLSEVKKGEDVVQEVRGTEVPRETQLAQTGDIWLMVALCLLTIAGVLVLALVVGHRIRRGKDSF